MTRKIVKRSTFFHDPSHTANVTSPETVPTADITEQDPKELQELLEHLHALRQAAKDELMKHYQPPSHLMSLPSMHRHRDTNVDRDEFKWISFTDIDGKKIKANKFKNTDSATNAQPISVDLKVTPDEKDKEIPEIYNTTISRDNNKTINEETAKEEKFTAKENSSLEIKEVQTKYTPQATPTSSSIEQETSREIFEDVFKRLNALGDRGKRVLARLHETMGVKYNRTSNKPKSDIMSGVTGSEEELDKLRKILVEAIDEEKNRPQRQEKRRSAREDARAKRELMLGQIELQKEFNEDDEARDYAAEEDLQPDGYAEHHEQVNETTPFDMSNSEFWSSFSSSEEALLECEGLILNLPLTPHSSCHKQATDGESFSAARANALTYRVPSNGYYFFVFNSENEVQTNFIKARFDLQKTRYDVARTALRECRNSSARCDLPLDIFSSQKVVLEVPLRNNDSLWNEQFVIISECEPRTSVYLTCVIAVPILIMMFAFQ